MLRDRADFFRVHGYLRLEGFHAATAMRPIKRQVLDALERKGLGSAEKHVPRPLQGLTAFQQTSRLSTLVRNPGLEDSLVNGPLRDVMSDLAGRALPPSQGLTLLLSPPHQGDWTLHRLNWHVDVAAASPERVPGIQAFVLIDDVAPHGGATLALSGSHRVARRGRRSHAALRELLRASQNVEEAIAEHRLSIVEMSGRAGDIFLMDMRVLHAPSVNATSRLRMMATSRYVFES